MKEHQLLLALENSKKNAMRLAYDLTCNNYLAYHYALEVLSFKILYKMREKQTLDELQVCIKYNLSQFDTFAFLTHLEELDVTKEYIDSAYYVNEFVYLYENFVKEVLRILNMQYEIK